MSSLSFTANLGDITKLSEGMGKSYLQMGAEMKVALNIAAIGIQKIARLEAPTKTGRLVNSINYKVTGLKATIGPSVKYGIYVETGTGIYGPTGTPIVPKSKKVLATKQNPGFGEAKGGYYIIGRSSKGQKANPYMQRTANKSGIIIQEAFKTTFAGFIRKMIP